MYVFMYVGVYEGCSLSVHEHFSGFLSPSVFLSLTARQTLPVENTVVHLIFFFLVLYIQFLASPGR